MEFLFHYGLFIAKVLTVVVAIVAVVAIIAGMGMRKKHGPKGHIEITDLNENYQSMYDSVEQAVLPEEQLKQLHKERKKQLKAEAKQEKSKAKSKKSSAELSKEPSKEQPITDKKRLFVLDFDGDIKASQVSGLKQSISAILKIADSNDEVLVKLESGGGMVHGYGLAASQLDRIKSKGIPLTIAVDKVAASGGYMMACVADKILAAPFAIIGSIGVVAQLPNFHRLLKKNDVDYEMLTAGEYKRTLTMFGENTDKGRAKFLEDLELTHNLFKDFVGEHRPDLDVDAVATGEIWYGRQAIDKGLIDEICTSDQYITDRLDSTRVIAVDYTFKKNVIDRISEAAESSVDRLAIKWVTRLLPTRPQV